MDHFFETSAERKRAGLGEDFINSTEDTLLFFNTDRDSSANPSQTQILDEFLLNTAESWSPNENSTFNFSNSQQLHQQQQHSVYSVYSQSSDTDSDSNLNAASAGSGSPAGSDFTAHTTMQHQFNQMTNPNSDEAVDLPLTFLNMIGDHFDAAPNSMQQVNGQQDSQMMLIDSCFDENELSE